jgi:quinol monooxygenase YgiN
MPPAVTLPAGASSMVAILDALPGRRDRLRGLIEELVPQVRAEPGCLWFLPFVGTDRPDRFYLFEVYAGPEAFERHLATEHVARFMAAVPTAAVEGSLAALHRLDEIIVPETRPEVT